MRVKKSTIAQIKWAMKQKGFNQTSLSQRVGMDRTTVNKLLNGGIDTMKPDMVDTFNDALGIELLPVVSLDGEVSQTAIALSKAAEVNEPLALILENLLEMVNGAGPNMAGVADAATMAEIESGS